MRVDEGLKCFRQACEGRGFKGNLGRFWFLSLVSLAYPGGKVRLLYGVMGSSVWDWKWIKNCPNFKRVSSLVWNKMLNIWFFHDKHMLLPLPPKRSHGTGFGGKRWRLGRNTVATLGPSGGWVPPSKSSWQTNSGPSGSSGKCSSLTGDTN